MEEAYLLETLYKASPILVINRIDVSTHTGPGIQLNTTTPGAGVLLIDYVCSSDWLPLGRQTTFPKEY